MVARLLTVVATALLVAAPSAAVPDCANTAPNTRTCVTPGHVAITTTPDPALTNPYPGWGFGFGTPAFGLGGRGIWIGF